MTEKQEQKNQALALFESGVTCRDIAAKFDISATTAWRWVDDARNVIKANMVLTALDRRYAESAKLDSLEAALWPAVLEGDTKAVKAALAVIQARIALHGAAEPTATTSNITMDTASPSIHDLQREQLARMTDEQLLAAIAECEGQINA